MVQRRRARRRAFAIAVMMLAVTLLAVFAVVATRLITSTMTLYREAATIDTEARVMDSALRQLREDLWGASRVDVSSPGTITIAGAAGGRVAWQAQADGALVRSAAAAGGTPGAPQRWAGIGARLSFEWDGVTLLVRGADRGSDRAGGVRMTSQVRLAKPGGER